MKPFASMPLTNVRQVSRSLVFRYQQNLPNLFCSCSQHNRGYFIIIIFFIFACVFFRPAKASAKRARSARNARRGKALHALFTLALACKRQTYFRLSLLSLRSDDRKFVCCSQATLAFARLKNTQKKKTPVAQAITPGPRLKVEFMKNKKQNKPTGKKRRSCLFKNKTCFERNEETVRLADSSVSVESMHSLLRLLILIIKI